MATAQTRFFGEPTGTSVEVVTSGRTIRPLFALPTELVDEATLTFDADGLHTRAVDPANVGLVELHAYPAAFEDYRVDGDDELTLGTNLGKLTSSLSDARLGKRTDDPVTLDLDATRTLVSIEREYETTTLSKTDEVLNIDPSSVRERPDVPDMRLAYRADIDVEAFVDAVAYIGNEHVELAEHDGHLVLSGYPRDDDETGTRVDAGDIAEPAAGEPNPGASSVYSMDYLSDFTSGLKAGKVTSLSLRWGDQFPLYMEFERRTDDDLLYEGRYMLAPRIADSGGDD